MRIIIICGAGYISGKEKIMFSLLKGFAKAGDEVFCITSAWNNGQFEELLLSADIGYAKLRLGFISKTFNWQAFQMTLNQVVCWPKLLYDFRKITSRFKPDVIIHTNFHHLFLLYPVVSNKKIVHIYHSHESVGNTKFYKKLFGRFERKTDLFIGVSEYVTRKMINLGIDKAKTRTIHNGLEQTEINPEPSRRSHVFTIGIIGQVGAWKGHEDLLLAIDILKQSAELPFKLCIFGDGKPGFTDEMKELINRRNLNDCVEWKGFVKDINIIYPQLDVVCVPSRSEEPFATSALEAGLFGLPVIVTNKGGFPEIIKNGYNGFIAASHAPGELAEKLALLIKEPALAKQMGLNHRQQVSQKFSYNKFIDTWRTTLSELTS
jgi:glycosyltransferase involved in cell wall biosynthesis